MGSSTTNEFGFTKRNFQHMDKIKNSANNKNMVFIKYKDKKGDITTRYVEPYEIKGNDLWAYDPVKDSIRRFKVKNIKSVKTTNKIYEPRWEIKMGKEQFYEEQIYKEAGEQIAYHASPVQDIKKFRKSEDTSGNNKGKVIFASREPSFSSAFGLKWNDGNARLDVETSNKDVPTKENYKGTVLRYTDDVNTESPCSMYKLKGDFKPLRYDKDLELVTNKDVKIISEEKFKSFKDMAKTYGLDLRKVNEDHIFDKLKGKKSSNFEKKSEEESAEKMDKVAYYENEIYKEAKKSQAIKPDAIFRADEPLKFKYNNKDVLKTMGTSMLIGAGVGGAAAGVPAYKNEKKKKKNKTKKDALKSSVAPSAKGAVVGSQIGAVLSGPIALYKRDQDIKQTKDLAKNQLKFMMARQNK